MSTEEELAATKLQAISRGKNARSEYKDLRDEEARKQWVEYYVSVGNYDEARELGWEGDEMDLPASSEELAASKIQANYRGKAAREQYKDTRDETARQQWVDYYLSVGDKDSAKELGWEEEDDAEPLAGKVPPLALKKPTGPPPPSSYVGSLVKAATPRAVYETIYAGEIKRENAIVVIQCGVRIMFAHREIEVRRNRVRFLRVLAQTEDRAARIIQKWRRRRIAWLKDREGEDKAAVAIQANQRRKIAMKEYEEKRTVIIERKEIDTKIEQVQQNHSALIIQRQQEQRMREAAMANMNGILFKRSRKSPRYQKRYYFVRSTNNDLSLCYTKGKGPDGPNAEEKAIKLDEISTIVISHKQRYEFYMQTTKRSDRYMFRATTAEDLHKWVDNLQKILPHAATA